MDKQGNPLMHDPFPKLAHLFLGEDGQLPAASLEQLKSADKTQEARDGLTEADKNIDWPGAWSFIKGKVPELFDVSVLDLLLAGWQKYALIADYAEQSRQEPGKSHRVTLHKHSLSSEHKPRIDLLINGQVINELQFKIKLKLDFSSIQLTLEDGELRALSTGECTGSGEVYLSDTQLYKKTFGKLSLPGEIVFSPGLAVPTRLEPYEWGEGPAKAAAKSIPDQSGDKRRHGALIKWVILGLLIVGFIFGVKLSRESGVSQLPPDSTSEQNELGQNEPEKDVTDEDVAEKDVTENDLTEEDVAENDLTEEDVAENDLTENDLTEEDVAEEDVQASSGEKAGTYGITIYASPPGATVRIMNIAPVYSPGIQVEPGRYHVVVSHAGHITQDRWVEIVDKDLSINIALTQKPITDESGRYRVVIHTDPPGAEISIFRNGRFESFKSGTRLKPGTYEFTARLDGYQPSIRHLQLDSKDTEITIKLHKDFIH